MKLRAIIISLLVGGNAMAVQPCPDRPNCVSSADSRSRRFIRPLTFSGPAAPAWARLQQVLDAVERLTIVEATDSYIRAETRSPTFGFVDDLEFRLEEKSGKIQMKSAARSGYWDLGVNRRRLERIREAFMASAGELRVIAGTTDSSR